MPDKFGKEALDAHNRYRSLHQAPQLKWSRSLEKDAESWAKQLAKEGRLKQGDTDDGESIYAVTGKSEVFGGEVVDRWYAEVDRSDDINKSHSTMRNIFSLEISKPVSQILNLPKLSFNLESV